MSLRPGHGPPGTPGMVSMTTPEMRPDGVATDRARAEEAMRLLLGVPVGFDVAVRDSAVAAVPTRGGLLLRSFPTCPDRRIARIDVLIASDSDQED